MLAQHGKYACIHWLADLHLHTSIKKSFSRQEIRPQLKPKPYQAIWAMVVKLDGLMGKRDSLYQLSGQMELDKDLDTPDKKDEALKRGGGSQRKCRVLVMPESSLADNPNTVHKPKRIGHLRLEIQYNYK